MNDSRKISRDRHLAGRDEHRQRERRKRLHELRPGQQPPAIVPIGDDAADQHEQQDRQLAQEAVEPQIEVRVGEIEDEPALRVALHPRADGGGERGEPQNAVVAMA